MNFGGFRGFRFLNPQFITQNRNFWQKPQWNEWIKLSQNILDRIFAISDNKQDYTTACDYTHFVGVIAEWKKRKEEEWWLSLVGVVACGPHRTART